MKIEHVGAALVVPRWGFISQQDQALPGPPLEATQERFLFLKSKVGGVVSQLPTSFFPPKAEF